MSVAVGRDDTIAAIATASGVGAVAIVRLSGREAHAIARRCGARFPNAPSAVVHTTVHAPDTPSEVIDDALVLRFDAPHSFTGEDVVEFQLHGGRVGSARMLAACVLAGAREALAGEFTERAVRHGRVDLLQGEAIGELIEARARGAHAAA
ncbi:MAG: hypothetical protein K2X99_12040, partial [Gemmatimonadaceae bacterium]|nr:hypothetical protein [Gemmatimonadaceae bacterium]